ncbi:MAG TPA: hypothetical protein VMW32_12330 [Bacteroidales bacterium]|nr:hypothetical protein [Bacteroidales bacterium]
MKKETLKKGNEITERINRITEPIAVITSAGDIDFKGKDQNGFGCYMRADKNGKCKTRTSGNIHLSEKAEEAIRIIVETFIVQVGKVLNSELESLNKELEDLQDEKDIELISDSHE